MGRPHRTHHAMLTIVAALLLVAQALAPLPVAAQCLDTLLLNATFEDGYSERGAGEVSWAQIAVTAQAQASTVTPPPTDTPPAAPEATPTIPRGSPRRPCPRGDRSWAATGALWWRWSPSASWC